MFVIPKSSFKNCPAEGNRYSDYELTLESGGDMLSGPIPGIRRGHRVIQFAKHMQERTKAVPPYVPYRTFRTFLEFLSEGVPDRIDRSVWGSRFSGTSGSQLMTALKALGLIDTAGRPQRELERLALAEGRERREAFRDMLRRSYGPVFELDLTRATKAQFHEAFRRFGAREGRAGEVRGVLHPGGAGRRTRVVAVHNRWTARRPPSGRAEGFTRLGSDGADTACGRGCGAGATPP